MQFTTIAAVLFASMAAAAPGEGYGSPQGGYPQQGGQGGFGGGSNGGSNGGFGGGNGGFGDPGQGGFGKGGVGKGGFYNQQYLEEKGDGSGYNLCSNTQKAACCNGPSKTDNGGFGILNGVLGGILSGNCALTVIDGQCTQGSIACCPTSGQQGLVNVGSICAPISL